jgi:cytochrome c oxidase subunit 2
MSKKNKLAGKHKARTNIIAFFLIAVFVLSLSGILLSKGLFKPALPEEKNVIDVDADMAGFDKEVIYVKVGVPVTIRLRSLDTMYHNDGGGNHQWAIDELGVNIIAPPKGTSMATFTPAKPGEYTFYCDLCCGGRANPSMNGKLIVEG